MPQRPEMPRFGKALRDPKPRPLCKGLSLSHLHLIQASMAVSLLETRAGGGHPGDTLRKSTVVQFGQGRHSARPSPNACVDSVVRTGQALSMKGFGCSERGC